MLTAGKLITALLQHISPVPLLVHLTLQHRYPMLCRPNLLVVARLLRRLPGAGCSGRGCCAALPLLLLLLLLCSHELVTQVGHLLLSQLHCLLQVGELAGELAAVLFGFDFVLYFLCACLVAVFPSCYGLAECCDGVIVFAQHLLLLVDLSQQTVQLVLLNSSANMERRTRR